MLTSDFTNKTIEVEPALPPLVDDTKDSLDHYKHVQNPPSDQKMPTYKLEYDALVISVGAYSASFGIPGVSRTVMGDCLFH
jgi:NADH dehydrogenase